MAQSSTAKEILKRLEEGTGEIYSRYEKLIRASDAGYDALLTQVDTDYRTAANRASAEAKIDLKNTLEKMADGGFLNSGETVQATIAANDNRNDALSALSVQRAKDIKAYESEKAEARATLSLQEEKEVTDYQKELSQTLLEQENADREFEAAEKQRAFDNSIKSQSLALEKATAAAKAQSADTKSQENGIEPEKDPYEYVDEIVERNTKYYKDKGYKVIDRKSILQAISAIVKDTTLSYRYRYEMYLYGKSLGYIK